MSYRIPKINELLKIELGKIILKELEFPLGVLVTLTRVESASDLMSAKVFVSVFPESQAASIMRILNSQIYFLQKIINRKLNMRPIPRLVLCQEKETSRAGRIEELLEQTKEELVEKTSKKR